MAVDQVAQSDTNAQLAHRLVAKKNEILETEANLALQKGKTEAAGKRAIQETIDKNQDDLVLISKEGASQADKLRSQNRAQSEALIANSQDHFLKQSEDAASKIKAMDGRVATQISDFQRSKLEKLAYIEQRSEDPFYHLKSFDATVADSEKDYLLTIKLPAHEAQNLFVTADGKNLKLSLARGFEASEKLESGHRNSTSSYQTIVENITLPGKPDMKQVQREYADGKLTLRIAKNI